MQWLIDLIKEWVTAQGYLSTSFVDRGDVVAPDLALGDLIQDDSWHDVPLKKWPVNAKAVLLRVWIANEMVEDIFLIKAKGSAGINYATFKPFVAIIENEFEVVVPVGTDGNLQYNISSSGMWITASLITKGWWL